MRSGLTYRPCGAIIGAPSAGWEERIAFVTDDRQDRLDLERAEGEGMLAGPLELQEAILSRYLGEPINA
jgi:hypothetical protein